MNKQIYDRIRSKSTEIHAQINDLRQTIHANPELSYCEFETMKFVSEHLKKLGIDSEINFGGTGVVALISNSTHNKNQTCIGLRADLDALPIEEENNVSYKSKVKGVMHACGHDVHTAILLGVAEILFELKEELPQPVKLIFQPGEEKNPGGATYMIRDGVLKNPTVAKMHALHVFPDMQVGKLGFKEGLYMASCDEIYFTVNGKGGHGATPHQCIDPIVIGANIITQLQQIISRNCDPKIPSVLSFGHFEALGATNIIPSKAIIKGTFRTMNEEWREKALTLIHNAAEQITMAAGGTIDIEISRGYPYLENDPETTRILMQKSQTFFGAENVEELPIRLTSEDFSFYSQEIPVCFFRLGVRNESLGIIHGVHHPKFDIDHDAILVGMQAMAISVFN
jgi:amidohydrolase